MSLGIHESPYLLVNVTQMLSQDDHQLWGSSITTGKTAFSDVLIDFREDRGGRAAQLTQESDNHANRSVVILVCLVYGAVM